MFCSLIDTYIHGRQVAHFQGPVFALGRYGSARLSDHFAQRAIRVWRGRQDRAAHELWRMGFDIRDASKLAGGKPARVTARLSTAVPLSTDPA